jgi:hypothetical protein
MNSLRFSTCYSLERIDESACVAALLANLRFDNSSPVHSSRLFTDGGVDGRIASMKPTIARAGRVAVMRTYC